ncbi:MAG: copper amine oxidase N-terminal domain-containing protein [Armatimonadota bacterium]
MCTIDEWTGRIYRYSAWYGSQPNIQTDPVVTASEAEQTALESCSYLELEVPTDDDTIQYPPPQSAFVLKNWGVFLDEDELGAQSVVWIIDLMVSLDPGYTASIYQAECTVESCLHEGVQVAALIDAQTGEWIDFVERGPAGNTRTLTRREAERIQTYQVRPPTAKGKAQHQRGVLDLDGITMREMRYPVRWVADSWYAYARYLPLIYGGTLEWRQSAARMSVAGKKVVLWPGSTDISIEGKRVSLKDPVKIIAGRTYVPPEAFRVICGAEATWDDESKVLRIVSGPIKPKAQFRRIAGTASSNNGERSGMP